MDAIKNCQGKHEVTGAIAVKMLLYRYKHILFMLMIGQLAVGFYLISLDSALLWSDFYDCCDNCLCFAVIRRVKNDAYFIVLQSWGYVSLKLVQASSSWG